VTFVFMVFHWPEPGREAELAASMREFGGVLRDLPGLVSVEPPFATEDGSCLVGISKWESEEAFRAAITLRGDDEIVPGETRPRQRFFLREA
jgi:heme-degrading monooxygenase HmoA